MPENNPDYPEINARLADIQSKYEASKGISFEDLSWLLRKMEQAMDIATAGQNLAHASRTMVDLQAVEIKRLREELAFYEV